MPRRSLKLAIARAPAEALVSYLICTQPRSGSALLADALATPGLAGTPDEYFSFHFATDEPYWLRRMGASGSADYIDRLIEATMTLNGVFGVKLHWAQVMHMQAMLVACLRERAPDAAALSYEELRARFGSTRYVRLKRKN